MVDSVSRNMPVGGASGTNGSSAATSRIGQPTISHAPADQRPGPNAPGPQHVKPRSNMCTRLYLLFFRRSPQPGDPNHRYQLMIDRYLKFIPGSELLPHHVNKEAFNRMEPDQQIEFFQKLKQDRREQIKDVRTKLWTKMSQEQHVTFALADFAFIPRLTANERSLYNQHTAERFRNFEPGDPLQPFDMTSSAFGSLAADEQVKFFRKLQQDDRKPELRDAIWAHGLSAEQRVELALSMRPRLQISDVPWEEVKQEEGFNMEDLESPTRSSFFPEEEINRSTGFNMEDLEVDLEEEPESSTRSSFFPQAETMQSLAWEKYASMAYETLGVSQEATAADITTAYRKLALKHHPDKAPPEQREEASRKFVQLSKAMNVIRKIRADMN